MYLLHGRGNQHAHKKSSLPQSQQKSCLQLHDALGTSNIHKLLYFCSSWFLVRTCSRSVASCCCCSAGLLSIPGMLDICSRASWIFAFSLASSWWTSWLSLSMLKERRTYKTPCYFADVMLFWTFCFVLNQPSSN